MEKGRKPSQAKDRPDTELLRSILSHMKLNQGLTLQQLINTYAEISPDESIPISIFAQSLSPSEALCTYLNRHRGLSFHEISLLINRDERSIWTSCERAKTNRGNLNKADADSLRIPTSLFHDRSLSILEHVVHHLKTYHHLTNSEISELLNKKQGSIATVANRAATKTATADEGSARKGGDRKR